MIIYYTWNKTQGKKFNNNIKSFTILDIQAKNHKILQAYRWQTINPKSLMQTEFNTLSYNYNALVSIWKHQIAS